MIKLFFCVGEASGDAHAADLIHNLQNSNINFNFVGMGGTKMHAAGCELIVDNRELAVVGLFEVLKHLPEILRAYKTIKNYLKTHRPDVVILIDYPGLNLRLAEYAKSLGLKVIYYIPPQIWAWKKGRIKKIKKYVDYVFVIYPFELPYYQQAQIPARLVKNPLAKNKIPKYNRQQFCEKYSLNSSDYIVGLAPGSRLGEIHRMLETILQAALLIKQKLLQVQFILPLAPSLTLNDVQPALQKYPQLAIQIIATDHVELMHACDAMIAVSGTVTVEIALAQTPVVVIYKVAPFTYFLGKYLIQVKYLSLTNLILNKPVLPELIQKQANPSQIAETLIRVMTDADEQKQMEADLAAFRNLLLGQDAETDVMEISQALLKYVIMPSQNFG